MHEIMQSHCTISINRSGRVLLNRPIPTLSRRRFPNVPDGALSQMEACNTQRHTGCRGSVTLLGLDGGGGVFAQPSTVLNRDEYFPALTHFDPWMDACWNGLRAGR
jgi:hypothetical protein